MQGFRVTYEIVTPESAKEGDAEDRGFVDHNGWRILANYGSKTPKTYMGLRAALQLCSPQEDSGRWFSEIDGRANFQTGAVETRSLHPPKNITGASYARLKRLLGAR